LLSCQRSGIGQPGSSRGVAVFVDETAEAVDPFDLPDAARRRWAVCRQWGLQVEASVWPRGVVVLDVDGEDVFEVAAVADQEPVQAFGPHGADPAFGVGVRLGRSRRRPDDSDAVRGEDVVEGGGELGVAVPDQQLPAESPGCAAVEPVVQGDGGIDEGAWVEAGGKLPS
jgi:hypothetical protein